MFIHTEENHFPCSVWCTAVQAHTYSCGACCRIASTVQNITSPCEPALTLAGISCSSGMNSGRRAGIRIQFESIRTLLNLNEDLWALEDLERLLDFAHAVLEVVAMADHGRRLDDDGQLLNLTVNFALQEMQKGGSFSGDPGLQQGARCCTTAWLHARARQSSCCPCKV